MLPRHYDGEMVTAYAYLGKRFGASTQTTAVLGEEMRQLPEFIELRERIATAIEL